MRSLWLCRLGLVVLLWQIGGALPAAAQTKVEPPSSKGKPCRPNWSKKVKVEFQKQTVLEVVKWIAKQTCRNFIVSSRVRGGRITILSERAVSVRQAYRAFMTALQSNKMTILRSGNYYKITFIHQARYKPIRTYVKGRFRHPNRDEVVTYLLRVRYINVSQLYSILRQMSSPSAGLTLYQQGNVIILNDYASNIHRLTRIARELDVPEAEVHDRLFIVQIENAQAQELVQKLQTIFQVTPRRQRRRRSRVQINESYRLTKVLADERTNRIILVCSNQAYLNASALIKKLDVPVEGEGQIRVHYLRYAKADEVAQTLSQLAQGTRGRRRRKKGKSPTQAADLFQGEVRITADKGTNSLVIVSSQRDYENLLGVIRRLDIRRKQVFVETVILEVSLEKSRELGVAFHGGANLSGDDTKPDLALFGTKLGGLSSLVLDPTALTGLAMMLRGPDIPNTSGLLGANSPAIPSFGVLIRAIQSNTDVDIISTPHILTATNEEASIQVGQNVPFIAGTTYSASALGVGSGFQLKNIQRQDVALTLKLKPQINAGDRVKMDIDLEVTELAGQDPELGPTTTKRKIKTTASARHQQTVVIGGLMRNKVSNGVSKIPILGDIPLLGALFRTKNKQTEKRNLLVFLTPHIILAPDDFRRIFERKMKERQQFLELFYARKVKTYKKRRMYKRGKGLVNQMVHTMKKDKATRPPFPRKTPPRARPPAQPPHEKEKPAPRPSSP